MNALYLDEAGSGPVALFVHGFPLDHTMWVAQTAALSGVRTCLSPDLAGFGASPNADGSSLSMERHADDLVRILDAYDTEHADLIGLSMGGYVALEMWARHSDRIRSMVLVDTRAGADDAAGKAKRDAAAAAVCAHGSAAFADGMLPKLVATDASEAVTSQLVRMMESTRVESIAGALIGMRNRLDHDQLLESIDVPSLVICGELDELTPPDIARAMVDRLPSAELALIPGAGHMSPMENPGAVNDVLLKFLNGRAAATDA